MTHRNTILNELQELESTIGSISIDGPYTVPINYFNELAVNVINRIRAMEAQNVIEETAILSPVLSNISNNNPYKVPVGYFESLDERIRSIIVGEASVDDELSTLSPLLSGIGRNNPYSIPQGYFDDLSENGFNKEKKQAKVVSMSRKWLQYAAAAVITGAVAILTIVMVTNSQLDPNKDPGVWVEKKVIKKVDADQVDAFVELTGKDENFADNNGQDVQPEIKELMKDVSEEEIQNFLNETAAAGNETDEILLN